MSDDFDDFELDGDIDLETVPDSSDPPPARYLCIIEKMEMRKAGSNASNPGKKFLNVQFKIKDVLDEALEQYIERSVFDIFNLNEASLWKIKGLIKACRGEAAGSRIPNMTGEMVVLDTFNDEYQGRVNLRTKGYKSADDWIGVAMDLTAEEAAGGAKPAEGDSGKAKSAAGKSTKQESAGSVEI